MGELLHKLQVQGAKTKKYTRAFARARLSINLNLSQNGVEGRQPPIGARGDSPRSTAPSRGEGVWGWG